jgi:hypothetical protein
MGNAESSPMPTTNIISSESRLVALDNIFIATSLSTPDLGISSSPHYDRKIEDSNFTKKTRRENIINEIAKSKKLKTFVMNIMSAADLNKNSIFYDLFQYLLVRWEKDLCTRKKYLEKDEYAKMATVSQEFSTIIVPSFRQSLLLGELRRLLKESPKTKQNAKLLEDVEDKILDRIQFVEKNSEIKTFPVRKLVQLQLGSLLLCLKYF